MIPLTQHEKDMFMLISGKSEKEYIHTYSLYPSLSSPDPFPLVLFSFLPFTHNPRPAKQSRQTPHLGRSVRELMDGNSDGSLSQQSCELSQHSRGGKKTARKPLQFLDGYSRSSAS